MIAITCSSPEPGKKILAYCEVCKKPMYQGRKVFKHDMTDELTDHYCSMDCLLKEFEIEIITLGEE